MKKFIQGFKEFALRGNVMDLAVGVMIGGAFNKIVTSLVNDMFMPLLGLLLGQINLGGAFLALDGNHYASAELAKAAGAAVFNYGAFLATVIDFVFTALVIYLVVMALGRFMHKKPAPAPVPEPRRCPHCLEPIHEKATRCPHCTADVQTET